MIVKSHIYYTGNSLKDINEYLDTFKGYRKDIYKANINLNYQIEQLEILDETNHNESLKVIINVGSVNLHEIISFAWRRIKINSQSEPEIIGPCWWEKKDVEKKEPDLYIYIQKNKHGIPHVTMCIREILIQNLIQQMEGLISSYKKTVMFCKEKITKARFTITTTRLII